MNQSVFTRVGRELSRVFAQLLREIGRNLRAIYSSSPHMHGRNKDIKDADRPKCLFPRSTLKTKQKAHLSCLAPSFHKMSLMYGRCTESPFRKGIFSPVCRQTASSAARVGRNILFLFLAASSSVVAPPSLPPPKASREVEEVRSRGMSRPTKTLLR